MSFRDLPAVSLKIDGRMTGLLVYEASGFLSRARGLLGRERLRDDEALWIHPCGSVHTIGMRYPIDVVFIDREARVLRVCAEVRAGRIRFAPSARGVLELRACRRPAGAGSRSSTS